MRGGDGCETRQGRTCARAGLRGWAGEAREVARREGLITRDGYNGREKGVAARQDVAGVHVGHGRLSLTGRGGAGTVTV